MKRLAWRATGEKVTRRRERKAYRKVPDFLIVNLFPPLPPVPARRLPAELSPSFPLRDLRLHRSFNIRHDLIDDVSAISAAQSDAEDRDGRIGGRSGEGDVAVGRLPDPAHRGGAFEEEGSSRFGDAA